MDGFEKRRESKKEDILSSALELFKEYGYNKVSIVEIAKRASVSQVSIYNFFESKENLKQELLKKLMNDHFVETINIFESPDSIKIKIEKFLLTRIHFFKSFSSHFLIESIDRKMITKENGMYIPKEYVEDEVYKEFIKGFQNIFEEGKKEGVFPSSVSIEAIMNYMEILQYYFINNPSIIEEFDSNPLLAKEIFSLFFYGLMER